MLRTPPEEFRSRGERVLRTPPEEFRSRGERVLRTPPEEFRSRGERVLRTPPEEFDLVQVADWRVRNDEGPEDRSPGPPLELCPA